MSQRKGVVEILITATIIRLVWILSSPAIPISDFDRYHILASRVATGLGFSGTVAPTAFSPPGYPLLLSLGYFIFSPSPVVGQVINVLLGVLTVYFTYLLGKHLVSEQVGLISATAIAFMPSLILYTALIASENLAVPLSLMYIVFFLYVFDEKGWVYIIPAGIALGLAVLTRPAYILYPGVFLLYAFLNKYPFWRSLKYVTVVCIITIVTILPWSIRNYLIWGEIIPVSTNGGFNLAISFNEASTGGYIGGITEKVLGKRFDWNSYSVEDSNISESEYDALLTESAISYIKEYPIESLKLAPYKFRNFILDDVSGVYYNSIGTNSIPNWGWRILKIWAQLYYVACLGLALIGVFTCHRLFPKARISLLILMILYWFFMHGLLFHGEDRFHQPLLPLTIILSSIGGIYFILLIGKKPWEKVISYKNQTAQ